MTRPDDDMLRALAAGVYPPTEAEARAMAAEVLRLRAERDAARTALRDYRDSPAGSAHVAWDALCDALGVGGDGGGR